MRDEENPPSTDLDENSRVGLDGTPENEKETDKLIEVESIKKAMHWNKVIYEKTMLILFSLGMVCLATIGIVICYEYCTTCLVGILLFSLCTCPFIPVMNVPLWISILVLVVGGWSFTHGHMSLVWSS